MNKVKIFFLGVIIVIIGIIIFYFNGQEKRKTTNMIPKKTVKNADSTGFIIGLATGLGGLGDRAFNDMEYNGLIMAKKKYKVNIKLKVPKDKNGLKQTLLSLINEGCNVVIAGEGYQSIDIVDEFSKKYPNIKFVLLDAYAKEYRDNVSSVTYKQNEGSFLVGALAGLMTKTNVIGVIGGDNIPVINDFFIGYEAGAKYINKNIKVLKGYITDASETANPWSSPKLAKHIASHMFDDKNADIIYAVAAASNLGVFNAAKERHKYAIGVDSNQDYLVPGTILTSMMKRLDLSIVFIVEKILTNRLENKSYELGLKDKGVSLTPMKYSSELIPNKYKEILYKIEDNIIKGKIKVPTVFKNK